MPKNLTKRLLEMMPSHPGIEIPPKAFIDMDAEIIDYSQGESLTARFPIKDRYQNPLGFMQGGIIVAAIDNTVGPLSFLIAPPSFTTHLNTTYIRPVAPKDGFIEVKASVVEITKNQIHMSAEVRNTHGKLLATSFVTCSIIDR